MKLALFLGGIAIGLDLAAHVVSAHPRHVSMCGCETDWQWDRDVSTFSGGRLEFRDHDGHATTIDIRDKDDAKRIATALTDWSRYL